MRTLLIAALALAAFTTATARRIDQDFEFDDDSEGAARRSRRYVYDPHSPLCRALVCARREECVLRDADTALCADREKLLRNGDVVVNANESDDGRDKELTDWNRDDDVFYEAAPEKSEPDRPGRCVGCGSVPRAQFLCGSDNRTYSSLCRLDLHNCVRRPAPPVALACRGFCPCAAPNPPGRVRPRTHSRLHTEHRDHDEHDDWRRRGRRRGRRPGAIRDNSIPTRRRPAAPEGEPCALDKMADRLLDWFSVLMDEAGASPPDRHGFPRDCKPETRWMFAHLDTDSDALLSPSELYALRHDDRERCLRPFLASCGAASETGEDSSSVTRAAWCGCLRRAARPCTALARAHAAAPGAYVPACDAAGYYRPRQCHTALGVCWCVDAHGVEVPGSRGKGAPSCPGDKLSANAISLSNETGEEAQEAQEARERPHHSHESHESHDSRGAPADDEDALTAGSGDSDLRF